MLYLLPFKLPQLGEGAGLHLQSDCCVILCISKEATAALAENRNGFTQAQPSTSFSGLWQVWQGLIWQDLWRMSFWLAKASRKPLLQTAQLTC